MKTNDITYVDGNALIADFMGCKVLENGKYEVEAHPYTIDGFGFMNEDDQYDKYYLCYDSDYSWLFKVVEKIEGLTSNNSDGYVLDSIGNQSRFIYTDGCRFLGDYNSHQTKILSIWYAVIEFIEWYNDNQKI